MTIAHKIAFTLGVLTLGFVGGVYVAKPATPVQASTHTVNGLVLSDAQFNEQMAAMQAANDKMEQDYAATLVQEQMANDAKMDAFVQALAQRAKQDHGLWIASPIKHDSKL